MGRSLILFVIFSLLSNVAGWSQTSEIRVIYKETIRLNESYKLGIDAGPYTGMDQADWMRYAFRGSLERKLSNRWAIDMGFMYNHIDKNSAIQYEYRPHQSIYLKLPVKQTIVLRHRLRLEERIFKAKDADGSDFSVRLRYRINTKNTFNGKPIQPKALFYALSAEWNMNVVKKNDSDGLFERGRYGVGLGYPFNTSWQTALTWYYQSNYETDIKPSSYHTIFEFKISHSLGNKS